MSTKNPKSSKSSATDKERRTYAETGSQVGLEEMSAFNGLNLDAYAQATQAVLRGFAAFNEELLAFANAQMRDSARTGQTILGCGDVSEALRLQVSATRAGTERYFAEAGRLMDLAVKINRECCAPLEHRTVQVMDEIHIATKD